MSAVYVASFVQCATSTLSAAAFSLVDPKIAKISKIHSGYAIKLLYLITTLFASNMFGLYARNLFTTRIEPLIYKNNPIKPLQRGIKNSVTELATAILFSVSFSLYQSRSR